MAGPGRQVERWGAHRDIDGGDGGRGAGAVVVAVVFIAEFWPQFSGQFWPQCRHGKVIMG